MSELAMYVPGSAIKELCSSFSVDYRDVYLIEITPRAVEVHSHRRSKTGEKFVEDGQIAHRCDSIPIRWSE